MAKTWAEQGGSTWQWRKVRRRVLERDRYRCQLAIPGTCTVKADCVHHLDGKAAGDDMARLMAACTPCNLKVGDPTRMVEGTWGGATRGATRSATGSATQGTPVPRDPEPRPSSLLRGTPPSRGGQVQ